MREILPWAFFGGVLLMLGFFVDIKEGTLMDASRGLIAPSNLSLNVA